MQKGYNGPLLRKIHELYIPVKDDIERRLTEFDELYRTCGDEEIFAELAFCLLTPQSKAKICWSAVCALKENKQLLSGTSVQISKELSGVRFHNTKARYIALARNQFMNGKKSIRTVIDGFAGPLELREWLVENVKGMGYKEASHFLRNIGKGGDLAILDRHILRNLKGLGVINEIPSHISRKTYLEIEKKMREFSSFSKIPMNHLDMLLWYKEAGGIFK